MKMHLSASLALALAFGGFAPSPLRADDTKSTKEYMEDESFHTVVLRSGDFTLSVKGNGWFSFESGGASQKGQVTDAEMRAIQKGNLSQFDIEAIKSEADRLREGGFVARALSTAAFTIELDKVMQVKHAVGPASFETHQLQHRTFSSKGRAAIDPTLARIADALFGIADRVSGGKVYASAKTIEGKIGYTPGSKDSPATFTLTTDDGKTFILDWSDWNPYAQVFDDAATRPIDTPPDVSLVLARVKEALGGERISVRGIVAIENEGAAIKPVRPLAVAKTASSPSKTRGILGRVSDARTP